MSRIFIENLPKNISQDELQKQFSLKGEITDIQLRKDKRNAFIGFKQPEQAQEAIEYFNKTFIRSSRISVKKADGFRLKKGENQKSNGINDQQNSIKIDPFEEVKNDPDFEDFLRLQRNIDLAKNKEIWKDDVLAEANQTNDDSASVDDEDSDNDKEENDELKKNVEKRLKKSFDYTVKIRGLPYKIKKSQLKEFLQPIKPLSMRFVPRVRGLAYVSFKNLNDLNQAMIKHRGFIDGRRIEITKIECNDKKTDQDTNNNDDGDKNNLNNNNKDKWNKSDKEMPEPISETGRIYVRNLCYTCTEDDLRQLFEQYGPLTELHLPIDSYTKKPKGFAFVTFVFPEHAIQAFNDLDKTDFQGRLIHLLPAYGKSEATYNGPPPPEDDNENNDASNQNKKSIFKQNKMEENKKDSQNSTNWNTLFIRSNAVADIMTKNLNVNKLDLLTQSDKKSNAAVRMALGEAQIVNEIKEFLIKNQVHLESFERGQDCPRSKTTILVKNLPADTTEDEIKQLFERYGLINRVILPPYGVTAIVDMQESNEAKFAFKKLAYNNFKHYPLYLEWAPDDVFAKKASSSSSSEQNSSEGNHKTTSTSQVQNDDERILEENATIFVKNLNFDTTEEDFRKHFETIGRIYSATIAKKKTPKGILSMGYGFVQFFQAKDAKEAIKKLQNSTLDGHKIEIKLSNRVTNTTAHNENITRKNILDKNPKTIKQTGSKICVKNIPFEATIGDIKKIFSTYGQLKSVRIPKKLTGSSLFRGFGFVDFVSKEDAKRAFDALSPSTHLYGRPLVLEWAKDDSNSNTNSSSIEDDPEKEIRQVGAKTARYFQHNHSDQGDSSINNSKRLKKNDLIADLKRRSTSSSLSSMHQEQQQDKWADIDD